MQDTDPSILSSGRPGSRDPGPLTGPEAERYHRHLVLPEVGPEGQLRLKGARVVLVGAGGLGTPVALYLAAAGVGQLTLVDDDRVEMANLQRQVMFDTSDVGRAKAEIAAARLRALNPHIDVTAVPARLTAANAFDILRGHDLVVDGSDNFATRYLVNDACVMLGIAHVHGSIFRFQGQVSLFAGRGGPCYRCLFPSPPPPGTAPDCAEAGVLGVLPGIVGSIQATEAIKWILQVGESLDGRLLRIDALTMTFSEFSIARDPDCPVCGDNPTVRELSDDPSCQVSPKEATHVSAPDMTAKELKRRLDAGDDLVVLDVREPHEHRIGNLSDLLIPMGQLPARMHELDADREIVVYCRTGSRSARAAEFLQDSGFEKVWNLKGGIYAWADDVDPDFPRY